MKNDDILKAAQRNKIRGKEFENREETLSTMISYITSIIVGTILFVVEYYSKGHLNISLIIVAITAIGSDTLYKGIRLKKKLSIVMGIILSTIALLALVAYLVIK
ncbi:MAG: hypothetical protein IIX44_11785 [Clostridia bacterium]|nr:hypothetical protein [Clostridia bacterium]